MINSMDYQYIEMVRNILGKGYFDNNRTGMPAYKLPHQVLEFDLEKEFPILQTKHVAFNTAVEEMLWIYKDQSNDVKKLQDKNIHIWDSWADKKGTIGKAYGYQIKKYNQIDTLINQLKTNPQDRRMLMNMWNIEDLPKMQLQPCCFMSLWDVTDGKLNCMLVQRSADAPIGLPFNTTQYAVLVHLIAQVTNLRVGKLTHVINNCHIYDNQVAGIRKQIKRFDDLCGYDKALHGSIGNYSKSVNIKNPMSDCGNKELYLASNSTPMLFVNPEITNFYDFTIDDIKLLDYFNLGKINFPVSV